MTQSCRTSQHIGHVTIHQNVLCWELHHAVYLQTLYIYVRDRGDFMSAGSLSYSTPVSWLTPYIPLLLEHVISCVPSQCLRVYDVEVKITDWWRNIMEVEGTCRGLCGVPTAAWPDCGNDTTQHSLCPSRDSKREHSQWKSAALSLHRPVRQDVHFRLFGYLSPLLH